MTPQTGPGGTPPRISVIVPVYNVEGFVAGCIWSLRAQTLDDFEAIVVDDGSTDSSLEAIWAAVEDDPRFRVVSKPNGGLSSARNLGLDLAQAPVIGFVDSDDSVEPDYLSALHDALEETGAPWAACAIRYVPTDGGGREHSAIHGTPFADVESSRPRVFHFSDWTEVIPHYPSAWNKLYRRSLIEDLRFMDGVHFEDHPFFHAAAQRTDRLAYVGRPLYRQTVGRTGQITRSDSDRVFDQFPVLERMASIMIGDARPGGTEAMSRIASRLVFERSNAIADPGRRERFARDCGAFFRAHGFRFSPDWDPAISPLWGLVINGELPLSIVIPVGDPAAPIEITLDSIADQPVRDLEILLVQNGEDPALTARLRDIAAARPQCRALGPAPRGLAAARNRGIDAARGTFLLFMYPGERLAGTRALRTRLERMIRSGADIGLTALRVPDRPGRFHSGFHDAPEREGQHAELLLTPETALQAEAGLSGKLWRRAMLNDGGLRFQRGHMSEWAFFLATAGPDRLASYYPGAAVEGPGGPGGQRWITEPPEADRLAAAVETASAALVSDLPPNVVRFHLMTRATAAILDSDLFPDRNARYRFRDAALQRLRDWSGPMPPWPADADLPEVGRGLHFQLRAEGALS